MATVSRGTKAQRFQFIAKQAGQYGVIPLCRHLSVSRSGYYAWCQREEPKHKLKDRMLLKVIHQVFNDSRQTYGSSRVHRALRRQGIYVSRKRVERLMRAAGLRARVVRVYRRLAGLHRFFQSIENRRLSLTKPRGRDQQWVADLTYIRYRKRWLYLAVVLDLYSRRVIGWSMGKRKNVSLTTTALKMAIRKRRPKPD